MKTFKVYQLTRKEYISESKHIGTNEQGEDIIETRYIYTGKVTKFLGRDKTELLNLNSIPQWKAKITGEFTAKLGHSKPGDNRYLFDCTPITIINPA